MPIRAGLIRVREPGEDGHVFAMLFDEIEVRRGLVIAPGLLWKQSRPVDAKTRANRDQALRRGRRRTEQAMRPHRVEEGQGERNAGAAQKGATGNWSRGYVHWIGVYLVWKMGLWITSWTSVRNPPPCCFTLAA